MDKKLKRNATFTEQLKRYTLLVTGTIFLGLGLIGIFLPLLPTTPFLLLAAACYARGSQTFYTWLISNKYFGVYIKNYQEGKGIPLKIKVMSILFLWIAILSSAFFIVTIFFVQIVLIAIAISVTAHIISIKTFHY
jgi:uncharacterized membrane protein YbaN (DUF454 family)